MAFDFKKSLIKVQGGRQYLPVSARIVWFREQHPDWGIQTEVVEINHEKQYAVFRATVTDAEGRVMATGTKKEDVKGFGDYIEKSETGAVGRALALCGFGTQFSPELDETGSSRLADTPMPMGDRSGGYSSSRFTQSPPHVSSPQSRPAVNPDHNGHGYSDDDTLVKEEAFSAPLKGDGSGECAACGKHLTKGQQDLSLRNYGEALCPNCQRDKPRASVAAI